MFINMQHAERGGGFRLNLAEAIEAYESGGRLRRCPRNSQSTTSILAMSTI